LVRSLRRRRPSMRAGLEAVVVDTVLVRSCVGRCDTAFRVWADPAAINILAIKMQ
jgi:hypothetical protein